MDSQSTEPQAVPKRPSMSKSALLVSPCSAWTNPEALWYDEERIDGVDHQKRDDGTVFHQVMDGHAKGNVTSHLKFSGDDQNVTKYVKMLQYAMDWLETVKQDPNVESIRTEVAMAVNWSTGHAVLLDVSDRHYPDMPGYQFGTADIVVEYLDGSFMIADWKTGEADGADEQLLSLATAWDLLADSVSETTCRTICLQVNEFGCWPHENVYTASQLRNHQYRMEMAWDDLDKHTEPVPGIHCTKLYCPALAYCPAITAVTVGLAETSADVTYAPKPDKRHLTVIDNPQNDDEAGMTMALIAASKRQQEYVINGIKDYIRKGGRAVFDGYEYSEGANGFRWRKIK